MNVNPTLKSSRGLPFAALTGLVVLGVFTRLIPHPANFTAIGAVALFAGSYFEKRWLAILLPLIALFVSDCILGFHDLMLYVYGAFIVVTFLGSWTLQNDKGSSKTGAKASDLVLTSLGASVIFFVISNFGVWMQSGFYSRSLSGLFECYVMALPFLDRQIFGDLFFSCALFSVAYYLQKKIPVEISKN